MMSSNARVFLIERVRDDFNLSSTKQFGELYYIFGIGERRASIFRTSLFCKSVLEKFENANFDNAKDFFCVTGGLIPVSLTLTMLVTKYEHINALLFNASDEGYAHRIVKHET